MKIMFVVLPTILVDFVDGEGVLVVGIADVSALVWLVGSTINEAPGIVNVAIAGGTALC
jgi:hypothetical protein